MIPGVFPVGDIQFKAGGNDVSTCPASHTQIIDLLKYGQKPQYLRLNLLWGASQPQVGAVSCLLTTHAGREDALEKTYHKNITFLA